MLFVKKFGNLKNFSREDKNSLLNRKKETIGQVFIKKEIIKY